MEDTPSNLTDRLVLEYLQKNCSDSVVKSFKKKKKLEVTKGEEEVSTSLKDILVTYKKDVSSSSMTGQENTASSTPIIKPKLVTSTPKPTIPVKANKSSSSDDSDSDDEADSDDDENTKKSSPVEKKKQLTKTRKKSSGKHFL